MVLFEDEQFLGEGAPPISCKTAGVALQSSMNKCIKACKWKDSQVERLEKERPHLFLSDNGLLLYEGCAYLPPNPKLREEILHDNHDAPVAGHPGIFKTNELIGRQYWWLTMLSDVKKLYVKGCDACQ